MKRGTFLLLIPAVACLPHREDTCPADPPRNRPCLSEGAVCGYGASACGYDEECRCRQGLWSCVSPSCVTDVPDASPEDLCEEDPSADVPSPLDLPPDPGDAGPGGCPAEPVLQGTCTGALQCAYGQECCCGQCHPSLVCTCTGGTWGCQATDACLIPGCPDALEDLPPSDLAVDPGPDAPPLPEGRCRNREDCLEPMGSCLPPGASPSCGICFRVEHPCGNDADCLDVPETPICAPSQRPCLCEPGALECQPRCDDPASPIPCDPVSEQCDPETGHCAPRICRGPKDCPVNHRCPIQDAPQCQRLGCHADQDCDVGFCVVGQCHAEPGTCDFPKP
ncbi:MAG TPA: hypothetical protein PLQ97_06125 [Myxococcota bacterium]|nr:hypothetical protein [Myxococcota bacterium]HQK50239.1 hypothetical protein [Myxococcota bacterium]